MGATSSAEDNRPGAATLFDLAPEGLASITAAVGRTRLRTFIALRWFAVAGQTVAVLVVSLLLGFELPLGLCLAVISSSAWLNVFLMLTYPQQHLTSPTQAGGQLIFDLLQLAAMIALTGGLSNPFLFLLIAPVTVAAVTLKPTYAAGLGMLAMIVAAAMSRFALPLPARDGVVTPLPDLLQAGNFAALVVGLAFFGISAWRVSQDEARLIQALDAAEVVMAREQRLSALGALSAMTAHELGTPLATIHLVASEMRAALPGDSPLNEDAELLRSEAERCRSILRKLAQEREAVDIVHAHLPLQALLREATAPYKTREVAVDIALEPGGDGAGAPPTIKRSPEILHALSAFVENAASFADTRVRVIASWTAEQIAITVRDDGPGFSASVLPKLGEPYISERGPAARGGGDMGLGFFIAKTLVERTGGRISTRNATPPKTGAVVQCVWRRERLEITDRIGG
jgi:two-component system, sensor histidine kinase RegB